MNNPEQKNATTPQKQAQEKLTDEQLNQLNAGAAPTGDIHIRLVDERPTWEVIPSPRN